MERLRHLHLCIQPGNPVERQEGEHLQELDHVRVSRAGEQVLVEFEGRQLVCIGINSKESNPQYAHALVTMTSKTAKVGQT